MENVVVLTGAGISAESGLMTFRDSNGLWENYRVEEVATIDAWDNDPELVLRFYNERRKNVLNARPNQAHFLLADLQRYFNVQIITQNIDDLHERAGSKNVIHLHGEINKMRSVENAQKLYSSFPEIKIGDLAEDGAQLRPHIVWFGEDVPLMGKAISITEKADIFIVVGTSLQVYPAAGLLYYLAPHAKKYAVDKEPVLRDQHNNFHVIQKPATTGVKELFDILTKR